MIHNVPRGVCAFYRHDNDTSGDNAQHHKGRLCLIGPSGDNKSTCVFFERCGRASAAPWRKQKTKSPRGPIKFYGVCFWRTVCHYRVNSPLVAITKSKNLKSTFCFLLSPRGPIIYYIMVYGNGTPYNMVQSSLMVKINIRSFLISFNYLKMLLSIKIFLN
jgi:hypothetical protein